MGESLYRKTFMLQRVLLHRCVSRLVAPTLSGCCGGTADGLWSCEVLWARTVRWTTTSTRQVHSASTRLTTLTTASQMCDELLRCVLNWISSQSVVSGSVYSCAHSVIIECRMNNWLECLIMDDRFVFWLVLLIREFWLICIYSPLKLKYEERQACVEEMIDLLEHHKVWSQLCGYWCLGVQAPGHQHPQCSPNTFVLSAVSSKYLINLNRCRIKVSFWSNTLLRQKTGKG